MNELLETTFIIYERNLGILKDVPLYVNIKAMLSRGIEFVDNVDGLTERKMLAMATRARNPSSSNAVKKATII